MSGKDGLTDEERLRVELLTRPDTMTLEQWQASFPSAPRMVWQPIATAPKDRTVLGFVPCGVEIDDHVYTWPEGTLLRRVPMRWHEPNERTSRAAGWYVPWFIVELGVWDDPSIEYEAIQVDPTHWMPLPEPPKE